MPQELNDHWLAVIGKSLAFLCLRQVEKDEPKAMAGIVPKVNFLMGLGLSQNDAADAVGSSRASVAELLRLARNKKAKSNGVKKKKRR